MIERGLLKPQSSFQEEARRLRNRFDASSARIAVYDEVQRLDEVAERAATTHVLDKAKSKLNPPLTKLDGNRDDIRYLITETTAMIQTKGNENAVEDHGPQLTRRQQRLLNRVTKRSLSLAERQEAKDAFELSRYLQQEECTRLQRIRAAKIVAQKKNRPNRAKLWINLPSKGSSLFGGVKYSNVRVFQGGLPGLGKRR